MGKGLRRWEIKCFGAFLLQREKGCGFGEGAAAREGVLGGGCLDGFCSDYLAVTTFYIHVSAWPEVIVVVVVFSLLFFARINTHVLLINFASSTGSE